MKMDAIFCLSSTLCPLSAVFSVTDSREMASTLWTFISAVF